MPMSQTALPTPLLERLPLDDDGPWPADWRVGPVTAGPDGRTTAWVAVRVEPFTVLPAVDDRDVAVALAAVHARRDGVTVWTLSVASTWTQWDAWR